MASPAPSSSSAQPGRETIAVRDVKKYFGPTRALDGVSFSARAGEIHAVVGGNGCGKSTLAKVVSGILQIDSGTVSILGEAPSTPSESRALGISTVYQEVLVADDASVVDNIFMGADRLFTKTSAQSWKAARAGQLMFELSGEPVDPHALAGTLPLSIKQWITIARALLSDPKILILDESSAALDFDSTERLFAKMRALRDGGTTVLIVTHRIAELVRISDRATVLRDGRDVGVLERQDITEQNLLALMTGEAPGTGHTAREPARPATPERALRATGIRLWPTGTPFDFDLRRGEIVGITGLDGQGQDAFVRVLAGVAPPLEGLVEVQDRAGEWAMVRNLPEAVRGRIAYVSGDRKREGIFASLSIFENLAMPLYREKKRAGILGIIDWATLNTTFAREAKNLLIKFGVKEDPITSLSGGNQQKVLIGRGFAMRPDVIVLNDPARGIDVGAKSELYKHLHQFAAEGRSVVYLSSEIEEFLGFATRVLVFRDGAPFDAFAGRGLDGKQVLAAMFGQTDGQGLAGPAGLHPQEGTGQLGGARSSSDGVRVHVDVPEALRAPRAQPAPVVHESLRSAPSQKADAPRVRIRIVEFDDKGETVGRGAPRQERRA